MRWWVDTENRMFADLLVHDGAIVAASERGAIKIDVDTGEVLWRHEYRGQLKDIVQVGSDLLLIGNDRSETAVTRISIHDGESDSEYRFPEFGRVQIATGRGINSVAIASDRYVGILDSSNGSISWGVEYGGFALEWVYPVAPNILATLLDSRLVFIWDKRYSREIETQIPKIRGVVQTDDQLLFAYGERSISCIDWTAREILWERQRDEIITSVTPDESGGGVVVARNNGFIIGHTSSGIPSVIGRISGSANLGVYNTASYLAWGDRNRGIRLVSNSLESKDDPSQTTLQITDVPRSNVNTAIVKGVLAGILMMAGLAGAKELLQFGLADGRPFGRFELGERRFAAILALVGGTFGAHKFYQGRETIAIYNLMLFWTGLPTLLGIYECLKYLRFSDNEYQKHLENLAERDQSLEGD
jgi:TM2 domain-containing membrane protein YozV